MLCFWLFIPHFQWRCSSFGRAFATRADGPSCSSAGWVAAWRWEDAFSLLSLLFHLLFFSICCCASPSQCLSARRSAGEEFSPHGSRSCCESTNLRRRFTFLRLFTWIFKTDILTLRYLWQWIVCRVYLLLQNWEDFFHMVLRSTNPTCRITYYIIKSI